MVTVPNARTGLVAAYTHTYWLLPATTLVYRDPPFPPAWPMPNGIVNFVRSGIGVVTCGTEQGDIVVSIAEREDDLSAWTEVVEHTLRLPATMYVSSTQLEPPDPALVFAGVGLWRVRLCARGRDEAAAVVIDPWAPVSTAPPLEEHQYSAWQVQDVEPPAVLKASDQYGASMGRLAEW